MQLTGKTLKSEYNANPISANIFCADPSCIEHEGKLYVFGTNDNQAYQLSDENTSNTYEKITSLVCFSTEDMNNWTYHGYIDVKKIAPWILAAWSPVIVKRIEKDGLTHFYLYFSNNGCGVGVLTSTNPLGPWTSPLKKPLINYDMKALNDVPNPFHPGVCIDQKGDAYLVCGGGFSKKGNDFMPGTVRIVKLSQNMISFDSKFYEIKAPYFFENSEIYFINDSYIYTYNNNWVARKKWDLQEIEPPSPCSISYMISKSPLETDSWNYKGHFFLNPGEMGLNYSNNHVYICNFKGKDYIFYHTLALQKIDSTTTGYRSICVDEIEVDRENCEIKMAAGTKKGVLAMGKINPFDIISAGTLFNCENIEFENIDSSLGFVMVKAKTDKAWTEIKFVDFDESSEEMFLQIKGKGIVKIYLDSLENQPIAEINCDFSDFTEISSKFFQKISGIHSVFFEFNLEKENQLLFKNWSVK